MYIGWVEEATITIANDIAPVTQGAPAVEPAKLTASHTQRMKVRAGVMARQVLGRVLHPGHLLKAIRLQAGRKANRHSFDDAQLALYHQILPTDFLHYGYFEDTARRPEDMSLAEVGRAQIRYSELLLDLAEDKSKPVLDVGCGMGGLTRMLRERGFESVAMTPCRIQAAHVRQTQASVTVLQCKLERMATENYVQRFGTVYTAESLQYLKLDQALPVLSKIMSPGGKWIASDYFRLRPGLDRTCPVWDEFQEKLAEHGWKISHQRDITANVLPTLAYVHMWTTRVAVPFMKFGILKMRAKQPAFYHFVEGVVNLIEGAVARNVDVIDPETFRRSRRYMLLVMEKVES